MRAELPQPKARPLPSSPATVDVAELKPSLVDGVRFVPHRVQSSDPFYRVEATDGRYFEIGYREYALLSQWDGSASVAESVSVAARHLRNDAMSMPEATSLLEWSSRCGLLDGVAADRSEEQKPLSRFNPFWLRLPLGQPDRLLHRFAWLGTILGSGWAAFAYALLLLAAVAAGSVNAPAVRESMSGILAPSNWLSLAAVWLGLKVIHEAAHAFAARRFGASVREAGLVFILFAPCAYVDVTSAWSLRSRWARVLIASAGIAAELAVAAALILLWPWFATAASQQAAANVIFAATVASLLFNGNPLMRFDAYYILSDLLNQPNLGTRGQAVVRGWFAKVLLGRQLEEPKREPLSVRLYGWLAAAWRVVVCVSLLSAAYTLAPGFGPPLIALGGLALGGPAIARTLQTLNQVRPIQRLRAAGLLACGVAIVSGMLMLPWPGSASAPGIVRGQPEAVVRARQSGFVEGVLVAEGQYVEAGQPILQLRNEELDEEVADLVNRVEQEALRIEQSRSNRATVSMQQQIDTRLGLKRQLRIAREKADRLLVVASQSGKLHLFDRIGLEGTHIDEGQDIGVIVAGTRSVWASVPGRVVEAFRQVDTSHDVHRERATADRSLVAIDPNGAEVPLALVRIAPRATLKPADRSLTAAFGGPLAVAATASPENDDVETSEPVFAVVADLPPRVRWPDGLGVRIATRSHRSVGGHLWLVASDYWAGLTQPTQ